MSKITITGTSGFVGVNLLNHLNVSHEIQPLSVRFTANQKFEFKTDVVIHLAGKAHDLKKVSSPQDYYDANLELTKQLFDGFLISNAQTFIFMSTVKAAADRVIGVLNEDIVPNPKTHYGKAKLQAEEYILSKEIPIEKRVFILRPCMIHGPGNKGNLNLLYSMVREGFPWPLGAFENQRSFCSIDNLCFVIKELLIQQNIPSGVYNVADDAPLSTNELIKLIAASQNKQAQIFHISKGLIRGLAKLGDYLHLPLNSERLQKLTESYAVSNAKTIQAIGKQLPVEVTEGLLNTFKSFLGHVK
jgi:nucleoside-diphosphate-sugar epimerase